MTADPFRLDHTPECPGPSSFYAVRNGYVYAACRRCSATAVRPPKKETAR